MPSREVRYIITGNAAGGVRAFKETERAALGAGERLEQTGSKLTKVGAGMESFGHKMLALSVPLLAVGGYSVKMGLDFERSMTQVQTQTGASSREVAYFSRQLLKMGHTGFDGTQLAEGLFRVASDGFKGAQALEVLKAAAMGAAISGADLEQTTNSLGGVLRTHLKDVHSAAGAMNILDSTVGLGKFRFEELNAALSSGFLVSAKRVGLGLGEIGNALDAMARKGVPPEEEATRLQKTLIQFQAVTGVAKTALHSIGLTQFQLAEDMKKHGLIFALQDLQHHLGRVNQYKGNAILAEAFGRSKGAGNVGALLESLPEMEKIAKERAKYGSIQHQLAITEKKDYFQVKQAEAEVKNTLIELGGVLIPTVVPAFKKVAEWTEKAVTWFKKLPQPVKDVAVGFTIFLAVGGPVLIFLGKIVGTLGSTITLLGKVKKFAEVGADAKEGATGLQIFAKGLLGIGGTVGGLLAVLAAMEAINRFVLKNKHNIFTEAFNFGKREGRNFAHSAYTQVTSPVASLLFGGANGGGGTGKPPKGSLQAEEIAMGYGPYHKAPKAIRELLLNELMRGEHPGQPIIVHTHVHLDGKEVARNTAEHVRNTPSIAKPVAEGVTKTAQFKAAH